MTSGASPTRTARLVSASYDERRRADAAPRPASPCSSGEAITGEFCDIEREYDIDPRVLGAGQNGSVRACTDRRTGRRRAVKSVRKGDPAVRPGLLAREIALLRELRHQDNIVHLLDVFEDAEYVHLVTDLCEGGELFSKIVQESSAENGASCFREGEAARIVHQILGAVSCMHQKGIAHRDIKPENVLFETSEEGSRVKVIDLGLSRKHFSGREPPMRALVGTPYYIAPEVLRGKYDKSCDMWSVGVVAYIMLCGYPPFNGADNDRTYRKVLSGRYRFSIEHWKGVSREAMDFIRRLLQVDPRRRMTVEQALRHPWITKRVNIDETERKEEGQENESIEVVYSETTRKHSMIHEGSPPRCKVRMSVFGL